MHENETYEDDRFEPLEEEPKKPTRVLFRDFVKVVAHPEAFEGALCEDYKPDYMFGDSRTQRFAKRLCWGCPARVKCLKHAVDNNLEFGVWGGYTEVERRKLKKRGQTPR